MHRVTSDQLHPAENRALRELYATAEALARHWAALGRRMDGDAAAELRAASDSMRRLVDDLATLTPTYGLYGSPAARGLGAGLARAQSAVIDRMLERNQALRIAALEAHHAHVLLLYLTALAELRADELLADALRGWSTAVARSEESLRAAALATAADPDAAIAPAENSASGRLGHALADRLGTLGEAIDRRRAGD